MADARTKPVKLDQEAADLFDTHKKEADKARKFRSHEKASKDAKREFLDLMGDAMFAELPDGRLIQRVHKKMDRKAQKATTVEWDELSEVPAGD